MGRNMENVVGRAVADGDLDGGPTCGFSSWGRGTIINDDVVSLLN